jgi:2-polyprenyl-6-methoxyphenol hydroxylase-like FAD-dependent oxidoreductase
VRPASRHLATLRGLVSTPADAALLGRMLPWWVALPLLKRATPLPRLVRFAQLDPRRTARDLEREAKVAALAEWLFKVRPRPARDNCLERSLVAYRYLGRLNAEPELVVGIGGEEGTTVGHVWVTVDGHPVHDQPATLDAYEAVVVFGADGRRSELRERAAAPAEPQRESERVDG